MVRATRRESGRLVLGLPLRQELLDLLAQSAALWSILLGESMRMRRSNVRRSPCSLLDAQREDGMRLRKSV
jgi:hypothetical protein